MAMSHPCGRVEMQSGHTRDNHLTKALANILPAPPSATHSAVRSVRTVRIHPNSTFAASSEVSESPLGLGHRTGRSDKIVFVSASGHWKPRLSARHCRIVPVRH